jgi:hypothetical protein
MSLVWCRRATSTERSSIAQPPPCRLARRATFVTISIPGVLKMNGKEWFRPLYRALFGVPAVKANERV